MRTYLATASSCCIAAVAKRHDREGEPNLAVSGDLCESVAHDLINAVLLDIDQPHLETRRTRRPPSGTDSSGDETSDLERDLDSPLRRVEGIVNGVVLGAILWALLLGVGALAFYS